MAAKSILNLDRMRLATIADGLAAALAASLPWSTSASGILIVLWLLTLIPTLDWNEVRRELATLAGGLPVLLVLLGALGMLWADVSLFERWKGLDSFLKLLAIPLLLVQFRRSERGLWVLGGFLLSCIVLWAVSTIVFAFPTLSFFKLQHDNVLVKNAATQSGEFVTCIFGLLFLAVESFNHRRWMLLFGLLAVALGMAASIFYVAIGRTSLIIIPVLLVLFAAKKLNARGIAVLFTCAVLIGITGWLSSPYLRGRTIDIWTEIKNYEANNEANSSSERIEFWKKSTAFVRTAPLIGHGTGSIHSLFIAGSVGDSGAGATITTNPHNQAFAVAIQLGLIGAALLWAMWIAHLLLFRGSGLAEWIGLVVIVQNIVGSLFNSHLFDFAQGWIYVVGVGVAGGIALKHRAQAAVATSARSS